MRARGEVEVEVEDGEMLAGRYWGCDCVAAKAVEHFEEV